MTRKPAAEPLYPRAALPWWMHFGYVLLSVAFACWLREQSHWLMRLAGIYVFLHAGGRIEAYWGLHAGE